MFPFNFSFGKKKSDEIDSDAIPPGTGAVGSENVSAKTDPDANEDGFNSTLAAMNAQLAQRWEQKKTPMTDALNAQIVQTIGLTNSEIEDQAPVQIAVAPDMMISQASGLVAQSAANYFDNVSKVALAGKAVLMKQMIENIAKEKLVQAGEDALGALVTDLLVGTAAAVAAAAGAMEASAASLAIKNINQSINNYRELRKGSVS